MKRLVLAAAVAASVLALPSSLAAGCVPTCDYNAVTHKVTIEPGGNTSFHMRSSVEGHILLDSIWCENIATVTNTDEIDVVAGAGDHQFWIELTEGTFRPGFTNEPGTSDEIEIKINLGAGGNDSVNIIGNDAIQKFDLGQDDSQLVTIPHINLNAGETNGIDYDVSLSNVEIVQASLLGGNDVFRARGLAGTGPDPLNLPLIVHGGPGADIIKGGDAGDQLYGDEGKAKDKIWGFGAADLIYLKDKHGGD